MIGSSFSVLILDFDGIYREQIRLSLLGEVLNLERYEGVRFMSSFAKLNDLDRSIPNRGRTVAFLGGGEFHHLSLIFLRRIKVPFVLLLFDKHFDGLKRDSDLLRCDSWLNFVFGLKNLLKVGFVYMVGGGRGNIWFLTPDASRLLKFLGNNWVYISIDKDILDIPITRWSKGWLPLDKLLVLISVIPKEKIIGVDICGEPDRIEFWKIRQSESINLAILDALGIEVSTHVYKNTKLIN
ncbi:MAG: hypothetical protein H5T91_09715 [Synergistetes bacterium]|nr:hypothetical protein [Synergistota bacterium]